MSLCIRLSLVLLTLSFISSTSMANYDFKIRDIRIEGLQRVSAGTVFAALPLSVGDNISDEQVRNATRALFRTGYFSNIILGADKDILVVGLEERPAVTAINLEGNKAIETEQLLSALRDNGLAEGQIFRRVILEGMSQELQRQYESARHFRRSRRRQRNRNRGRSR